MGVSRRVGRPTPFQLCTLIGVSRYRALRPRALVEADIEVRFPCRVVYVRDNAMVEGVLRCKVLIEPPDGEAVPEDSVVEPSGYESDSEVGDPTDDPGATPRYEQEKLSTAIADEYDALNLEVDRLLFQLDYLRNCTTEHGKAIDQVGHGIQKTSRPP